MTRLPFQQTIVWFMRCFLRLKDLVEMMQEDLLLIHQNSDFDISGI